MKHMSTRPLVLITLLSSLSVQADSGEGKILHDQSCAGCHDTSVYSRPDKRIKSLGNLQAQVSRCTKPAGADWTPQEIDSVVNYLNTEFYHYK